MATILIVEDDMNIHQMVKEYFEKGGDTCISAFSGTEALLQLKPQQPDIVLLDLMLPGMNGEKALQAIRKIQAELPIVVVSAKNSLSDRVNLLNLGADDFICKPFALEELKARIAVQLRKCSALQMSEEVNYHGMILRNDLRTLSFPDGEVILTRHEYRIMELLMSHPQQAFTKKEIYEYAWEDVYAADDKTIHVHISNIRSKCVTFQEDIIDTVWGIGFKMK